MSNDKEAEEIINRDTNKVFVKEDQIKGLEEKLKASDNLGAKLFLDSFNKGEVTATLDINKSPQNIKFNFPIQNYTFDKLDDIFQDQKQFKTKIDSKFKDQEFQCYNLTQEEYDILDDINNIIEEAIEARRCIFRKRWSEKHFKFDKKEVLKELIDVSKFNIQAIIRLGYGAPDFYNGHKDKTKTNEDRQKNGY